MCALHRARNAAGATGSMVAHARTLGFSEGEALGIMCGWDDQRSPVMAAALRRACRLREGFDAGVDLGRRLYQIANP